jgi:hypothetical protein
MAGDELELACLGCGGAAMLEPAWDDVDSPQVWRGAMRVLVVDGRPRFLHEHPDCVSCATEVW